MATYFALGPTRSPSRPKPSLVASMRSGIGAGNASHSLEDEYIVVWHRVTRADVLRAIEDHDQLGPERSFPEHGFAPTTTYELVWEKAATRRKQSWAQLMSSPAWLQ